jgi:Holliday junction resolvase
LKGYKLVTSNEKGARAETQIRDKLRLLTGLQFERIPSSGALDPKHGLKGDLYVVGVHNNYCIEVKHYKDDHLTSKILTDKNPQLFEWWEQTVRQSKQVNKIPLLIFKHDRSKIFCAYQELPTEVSYIWISRDKVSMNVSLLEDFVTKEKPKFI